MKDATKRVGHSYTPTCLPTSGRVPAPDPRGCPLRTAVPVGKGMAMKLGLDIGYSGAKIALPMDKILLAEKVGFVSLVSRGLWLGRSHTPGLHWRVDQEAAARNRHRPASRAHAYQPRDDRSNRRCTGRRRPHGYRPRRFEPASRGGLVWATLGQARRMHPRPYYDHAKGLAVPGTADP